MEPSTNPCFSLGKSLIIICEGQLLQLQSSLFTLFNPFDEGFMVLLKHQLALTQVPIRYPWHRMLITTLQTMGKVSTSEMLPDCSQVSSKENALLQNSISFRKIIARCACYSST